MCLGQPPGVGECTYPAGNLDLWKVLMDKDESRSPGGPRLRVFSEVRIHRGPDGSFRLRDQADASVWRLYADGPGLVGGVSLAARVGPLNPAATMPVADVAVHELPWFEGTWGLVRQLGAVLIALAVAVRTPRLCLFRLPGSLSLLGAVTARLARRPYVVEVVGDPVAVLRSGVAGRLGRALTPLCRRLMRWSTAGALAARYETDSTLQRLYPPAAGAWSVNYSTVDLAPEDIAPGPRQQGPTVTTLIAVGMQDQLYKGHDDLITAASLLRDQGRPIEVVIVGHGRHHNALRQMAVDLGVADAVHFAGRVNDRTALREFFGRADLFCMPSRTEGLPRALIEAMAQGLPAVGTAVGGIPELLGPDVLVPPDDPHALAAMIARLSDNPTARAEAAHQNHQRALCFTRGAQEEARTSWRRQVLALSAPDPLGIAAPHVEEP